MDFEREATLVGSYGQEGQMQFCCHHRGDVPDIFMGRPYASGVHGGITWPSYAGLASKPCGLA